MPFLNKDQGALTSARNDGYGNPVTDVHIKGTKVVQQMTENHATNNTLTFTNNIYYIGIYNRDEVNDGVFNVNGIDLYIPAKEYAEFGVGGSLRNTVQISQSTSYIVTRFE